MTYIFSLAEKLSKGPPDLFPFFFLGSRSGCLDSMWRHRLVVPELPFFLSFIFHPKISKVSNDKLKDVPITDGAIRSDKTGKRQTSLLLIQYLLRRGRV